MKFGHRSQNQPVVLAGTNSCYLTTQNHGFAVKKIPKDFKGHVFTISNTIVGYEWNSNGSANAYQNNIKTFTKNIIDYLYSINND